MPKQAVVIKVVPGRGGFSRFVVQPTDSHYEKGRRVGYEADVRTFEYAAEEEWAKIDALAGVLKNPRHMQICELLAEGRSKTEIARTMGIKRRTFYTHLDRIKKKLLDAGVK